MKVLLVTVAGVSSRFSTSVGYQCLKCIYYTNDICESLLYKMVHQEEFDLYVIVGGFQFNDLKQTVNVIFEKFPDRILLVYNDKYNLYGSGYSLFLGLRALENIKYDELVFAEGDLYVDNESFRKVYSSVKNVITTNMKPILAEKSVAFYFDTSFKLHYIYDTNHDVFEISEPFTSIFNSAQIWKFTQPDKVLKTYKAISSLSWHGTNLVFIQAYFGDLSIDGFEIITFNQWVNCNTVMDFNSIT